jgi:Zn finger protein HypA/HybF involved in hydrogenase expression
MHERLIADELLEQAGHRARENGISRIAKIRVHLGKESHITEEALSSWFNLAKAGTVAEQAVLEIDNGEGADILMVSLQGEMLDDYKRSRS